MVDQTQATAETAGAAGGAGGRARRREAPSVLGLAPLAARLGLPLLTLIGGAIVLVVVANTVAQVRLNTWNGDFYGALEKRDLSTFLDQLVVFTILAAILLVLVVAQTWLTEIAKVRVRERLTGELLDRWLHPRCPFKLGLAGEIGSNPDQRLQEDVRHLSELTVGLAVGLLQSTLLLFTFIGVLWTLSTPLPVHVFGTTVVVHGLMLWGTLFFSIAGSALTWWVGAPLVYLHQRRYAQEAQFRFTIVRVAEAAQEVAFHHGEAQERRTIGEAFARTATIMTQLAGAVARVTWVTSGYGWLAIVAPAVVAAPAYFSGALTFGELMMVVQAFYQVQQSLRWFVDNYGTIADWRATRTRVNDFRTALDAVDALGEDTERITLTQHPEGKLVFERLRIRLPEGDSRFDDDVVVIEPGERVLVVGAAGVGKSMLFRSMVGLWPWGSGTIHLPAEDELAFLSQRPYLPLGDLRAALAYPQTPDRWSDADYRRVLERVQLGAHADQLGVVRRWDRELTIEEQQRLSFARLLLQRPRWVFLDEAASACAEDHRNTILGILDDELRDAAVVGLSREPQTDGLFHRRLTLRRAGTAKLRLQLPAHCQPAAGSEAAVAGVPIPPPHVTTPARPGTHDAEPGTTTPVRVAGTRPPGSDHPEG